MICYLIIPKKKLVLKTDYDGKLQTLYDLLDYDGIDGTYINNDNDCPFVDDTGMLTGGNGYFRIDGCPYAMFAGRGLITGGDGEGNVTDPHEPFQQFCERVQFL